MITLEVLNDGLTPMGFTDLAGAVTRLMLMDGGPPAPPLSKGKEGKAGDFAVFTAKRNIAIGLEM